MRLQSNTWYERHEWSPRVHTALGKPSTTYPPLPRRPQRGHDQFSGKHPIAIIGANTSRGKRATYENLQPSAVGHFNLSRDRQRSSAKVQARMPKFSKRHSYQRAPSRRNHGLMSPSVSPYRHNHGLMSQLYATPDLHNHGATQLSINMA